jgi:beta-glucanase (GH16 family)
VVKELGTVKIHDMRTTLLVSFLFFLSACKSQEQEVPVRPTNLVVSTEISTDGSGLVKFKAKADNATNYLFSFGDGASIDNANGEVSHTYTISEFYPIKVTAFSKNNLFIEETTGVNVKVAIPSTGYSTPLSYPGLKLVWQDEFEGNEINKSFWKFEIGGGGWGNNELQYYQEQNTTIENGNLIIKAKRESVGGREYTSSRLVTLGNKAFKYARVDIRAKLPKGQGIWPALWMLGVNINTVSWPKCGEIDIMEMIGGGPDRDNKVYGTVHWDDKGNHAQYGGSKTLTNGQNLADEFHVFSIVWDATFITWYLDDVKFHVIDITPSDLSELREEAFFIFNVAVGGNWPGSPNASTVFPQYMAVDYIRVFQ